MEPHPIMESIEKRTPHSMKTWAILLIVLLFGVTIGGSITSSQLSGSQEGASIRSQTKYVNGTRVLYSTEQAYLCAKPDGSDSYISSFGSLPAEFWTSGYYCQIMATRPLTNSINVLVTPTPQEMFRMHTTSTLLSGPGINFRPYKYECDGSLEYFEFTPPPTPPNNVYYQGVKCSALFSN